MSKLIKLIYLLVFLISAFTAEAQNRCESLFNSESKNKLNDQLIANINSNFRKLKAPYIIENGALYFKTGRSSKQKVSDISIIQPDYVFEYQDKSYYDYWMSLGGINKAEMDAMIEETGQAFGRGFYVSMSATDSREYGDYLSVFTIKKPLIVLERSGSSNYINQIFNSKEHTNFLRYAGISGVRDKQTWLNIFDESALGPIEKMNKDSYAYALNLMFDSHKRQELGLKNPEEIFNPLLLISVLNISPKEVDLFKYKKDSDNVDLDKLLSLPISNYNKLEYSILISAFRFNPTKTISKIFQQRDGLEKLRYVFNQMTISDLNRLENLKYKFIAQEALDILGTIARRILFFDKIFKFQDIRDIAKLKSAKPTERIKWYEKFVSGQPNDIGAQTKVKTIDQLREAVQKITESKVEIRDESTAYRFENVEADEFAIGLNPEQVLKSNRLFFLSRGGSVDNLSRFSYEQYSKGKLEHLDIFSWERFESVFSNSEKEILKSVLSQVISNKKSRKAATKEFVELLSQKLFDQRYFLKLTKLISLGSERPSVLALCSVFLSVAPFKQDNHLAVRLYYQYLIQNHFNARTEELGDYLQLTNQDSFLFESLAEFPRQNYNGFMWFINRLWVVSASSQEEMIDRSIALTNSEHYGTNMKQIKALQ